MYIIYKTTNLINGKIYIGQHLVKNEINLDPWYLGSGTFLFKAIKKYGRDNFKREVLCKILNNDIYKTNKLEEYFINKFDCLRLGYNIIKGSPFEHNPMMNPDVAAKVSYKLRNGSHHDVSGEKNPNFGNGYKISGDKNPMKNIEVSKRNSELRRGHKRNEEQRKRISDSKRGRGLGESNSNFGNKWSEEKKRELSEKIKRKNILKRIENENTIC